MDEEHFAELYCEELELVYLAMADGDLVRAMDIFYREFSQYIPLNTPADARKVARVHRKTSAHSG